MGKNTSYNIVAVIIGVTYTLCVRMWIDGR